MEKNWKQPTFAGLKKIAEASKILADAILEHERKKLESLKRVLETKQRQRASKSDN